MTKGVLHNHKVAVPPSISEQATIAAFLDAETDKIDEAIKELEESVLLLGEELATAIAHGVRQTVDSKAKLKDSGAEWLGRVPAHWKLVRIGDCFRDSAETGEQGLPFLTVSIHSGVSDRQILEDEMDRKVIRSEDHAKYLRARPGDIVYNMMRAWQGALGAVKVDGLVSPAYVVARPTTDVDSQFVECLLRTAPGIAEMNRFSKGITDFRKRLYWEEFKSLRIALPPKDESDRIVASLQQAKARTEQLIAEKQALIESLKEYRTSLIYEAVTGKIDLRAA